MFGSKKKEIDQDPVFQTLYFKYKRNPILLKLFSLL